MYFHQGIPWASAEPLFSASEHYVGLPTDDRFDDLRNQPRIVLVVGVDLTTMSAPARSASA